MTPPTPHGIVLFAHGSRDPAWRAPIETIAQRMRAIEPAARVVCAYLELTEPSLPEAVAALIDGGARHITVWPMFLGTGRHAREDLPRLLAQLRQQHPQIGFSLRPAIAEHPGVIEVMARTALEPPSP
ncbi:MAG: CbiX/SirB N-terminal domain-containing protein [Burkholderiales bacterium]|nr:CbiX/SirB N-terminal domain-containing protein [Burkholderiales bacterium]MBK8665599.1 CbiX/SirB N-terminal domain-containing protein [Burkholderiales bacterium]